MERTERSSIQPPLSAHDTDFAYPREGGHVRDISSDHIMSAPTCAATGTPKKGRFGAKALTVEIPLTPMNTMTTPKAPKAIDYLKKCKFRVKALAVMNALKAVKLSTVLTIVGAFGLGKAIGRHNVAVVRAELQCTRGAQRYRSPLQIRWC